MILSVHLLIPMLALLLLLLLKPRSSDLPRRVLSMIPLPARPPGMIALAALVLFSAFGELNSSFAAVLNVPSEFATVP